MNNIANFTLRAGMGVALLFSMTGTVLAAPGDAALGDGLFARISTSMGDIVVRLEYEKTPITVCNFAALAEGKMTAARGKPFYNGLIFHRVIAGFMIQGGDPLGTGMGGPGYRFADEFDPSLRHDGPGVLSMANAGPGTNGSQFFITLAATPHLDGRHTVFGRVVKGLDVLQAIGKVRTDANDKPLTPVTMRNVAIVRNGAGANAFKADQAAFDALIGNVAAAEEAKLAAKRDADLALIEQKFPGAELKPSGLRWIIQKAGAGAKPAPGSSAMVNFKGMFLNGESFDNSDLAGGAVEFPVGVGRLLPGLDETIMDMAPGEKRTAIIPPELAFGNRWVEDVIPPNSFLVYEIELVRIK